MIRGLLCVPRLYVTFENIDTVSAVYNTPVSFIPYVHSLSLHHGLYLISNGKRPKKKKLEKGRVLPWLCVHSSARSRPSPTPRPAEDEYTQEPSSSLCREHFPSYISCLSLPRLPLLPFYSTLYHQLMWCAVYGIIIYFPFFFTLSLSKSPMTSYIYTQADTIFVYCVYTIRAVLPSSLLYTHTLVSKKETSQTHFFYFYVYHNPPSFFF